MNPKNVLFAFCQTEKYFTFRAKFNFRMFFLPVDVFDRVFSRIELASRGITEYGKPFIISMYK